MPHTPLPKASIDVAPTRGAERIRAVIEVEVTPERGTPVHAWATDISESGLYLQTTAAFAESDRISLRFTLDGAVVAITNARVTRVRPFEPINVTGDMPGAAVVFDEISPLERARVKRFVRQQLPGGDLDDTLPPTLLAQEPRRPREETLPLHFAAADAEVNHTPAELDDDPTPVSPSRFDEIVTSLPPVESLAPSHPANSPQANNDSRDDNPSLLSALRPLSLPPVSIRPDEDEFEWPSPNTFDPVSVVPKSAVPRSVDDVFASIDRELRLDAFLADNPDLRSGLPSEVPAEVPASTEAVVGDSSIDDDTIDFSQISEWKFVIAGRATPLPPQATAPPEPAPATWADAFDDEVHVPTGLPDLALRTETLPGGPADERLHPVSLRPSMSLLREDSSPLDRTRPEIPSQKPMLVTHETRPEIPSRKPTLISDHTRPEIPSQKPGFIDRLPAIDPVTADVPRDDRERAPSPAAPAQTDAATTGEPPKDEEGMTMSGLWFAEGDEIAERLANGRSLPPGVRFDDGDSLLLHADDDEEEDAAAEEFVASLGAHLLARDSTVGLSDASLNGLDDSLLRNVHLSDSEVAFANHLEDAPMPSPSMLTVEPTPAPDADARLAQIFDDSADCIATSTVGQEALEFNRDVTTDVQRPLGEVSTDDDSSYGDLSLHGDSDEAFALPGDLDRSIREDQGGVFGRMGHHELTHRISRRRKTPWRAIALGAAVVAATGIGVGLALIEEPNPTSGALKAAVATSSTDSSRPKSVAEVESGLATAGTQGDAPTKPIAVAPALPATPVVAKTPPPAPKAPTLSPAVPTPAPSSAAKVAMQTATSETPTKAMVVERGRITVPLVGGTVKKKFALSSPPRVVVDLVGATFPGNLKEAVGKHGIAGVRFGRPDGKTVRFVVELEGSGTPSNLSVLKRANSLAVAWR